MLDSFQVLDTLKFKDDKIFLKKFHFERSFEACQLINPYVNREKVAQIYELIEATYSKIIRNDQMIRLLFTSDENPKYKTEIVDKTILPTVIKLQLINYPTQPSGVGKQNYKWTYREFWSEVMKSKLPEADDVICVNEHNEVTETSRCNLFFYDTTTDQVFTPSLQSGCISGAYRRYVMENRNIMLPELGLKEVHERSILSSEIDHYQIYMANSVREVLMAQLLLLC